MITPTSSKRQAVVDLITKGSHKHLWKNLAKQVHVAE